MNATTETNKNPNKRKKMIVVFLGAAAVIAVGFAAYHLIWGKYSETTDNAYVGGDMITVSSQVNGNIKAVMVDDMQTVQAGQVLIKLDETDAQLALSQTTAKLTDTIRSVKSLYDQVSINRAGQSARQAEINQAQDQLKRLQTEGNRLKSELTRRQKAYKQGAVSTEELEQAQSAYTQAQAQLSGALSAKKQAEAGFTQAQATLTSSMNQTRDLKIAEHPKVLQAMADVRVAYINLQRSAIVAPIAGQVAKRAAQVGTRITSGTPLLSIIPLDQVWVEANFKEGQLPRIRVGQPVELQADVYGGDVTYHGKILGLSAGTGSAFSMLPAQNATGNWIKIVQRVPVRIQINADDLKKHPLRIGLSIDVNVDTHNVDGALVSSSTAAPERETKVYDKAATEAEEYANNLLKKELTSS